MQSVITLDMINAFAAKEQIDLADGSQYPGVIGTLTMIESGEGTIQGGLGELVQSEEHKDTFAALVAAHEAAVAAKNSGTEEKAGEEAKGEESAA